MAPLDASADAALDVPMRIWPPLLALLIAAPVAAQTKPTPTPTEPTKPATAPRTQKPPPSSAAATRALVLTVEVTNAEGQAQDGVKVTTTGPVVREVTTDQSGLARLTGIKPGDYRLRLEKEGLYTLERDVTVKPGQSMAVDVTMNEAPAPPPPPPAAPEPTNAATPKSTPGEPRTLSLSDYIERNLIGREPMKQSTLGCSGLLRAVLLQVRDPLPEQTDDQLDQTLYVVAGQGTLKLAGRESPLVASSFAIVPRGTPFALTRRGNTPLIALLTRANEPCDNSAK
jgi:mannose-6-phosphate isomerase-like protein (cupin superfamily)